MVAPLVSYSRTQTVRRSYYEPRNKATYSPVVYQLVQSGFKQKPPFDIDTAYSATIYQHLVGGAAPFPGVNDIKRDLTAATNQARAKFVGALGDSSSFGATLTAERRSTWGTVSGGITKALLAGNAVRRGKLGKAAQILGFYPPVEKRKLKTSGKRRKVKRVYVKRWVMPDGRLVTQTAANYWLWYSYGVKPLVSDIYNGMSVLTRESPSTLVEGAGYSASKTLGSTWQAIQLETSSSVRISAHVRVANPNLWLANQLGLINPVQWINEAIPFSFVVDWFSNLSQIINQMTDFVGLEIEKPITTSKSSGTQSILMFSKGGAKDVTNRVQFNRTLSIPSAKLRFAYERFQWQRGANAISLLVGFMSKSPLSKS